MTPQWAYDTVSEMLLAATSCGAVCHLGTPNDRCAIDILCCGDRMPCVLEADFIEGIRAGENCDAYFSVVVTFKLSLCVPDRAETVEEISARSALRSSILFGLAAWANQNYCSTTTMSGWDCVGAVGDCEQWQSVWVVEQPLF